MPNNVPDYDPRAFPPVAATVDIAVFTIRSARLHMLLVQRGQEPYLDHWALPGGFVRPDEDLDSAAARELEEETGLTGDTRFLEQLASYGRPDRDPRMRVVTVAYWAVCAEVEPRGGGDAASAALLPVAAIEDGSLQLAFDHRKIVKDALERLRSKLEYTAVAAKFCPSEFTISELRRVYEAVWGMRLDAGNFQRMVRQNGTFKQASPSMRADAARGGRPASLWSARSDSPLPRLEYAPRRIRRRDP
jgi:8-oxo-dGTP diphosphatase